MRLWGRRARRSDAEWLFHSKELQRRHAPPEPCNPPRSDLAKWMKSRIVRKCFSVTELAIQQAVNFRF